jgi:hypothetical protein
MNKKRTTNNILLSLFWIFSIVLSACSKPTNATPTLDPVLIQTQAVATFAAGLTQTALAQPTATSTITPSPSPTETATPTVTRTPAPVILPTNSCNVLTFISDVNIPDNSKLAPGQIFTKTWRVENSGDCAWEEDYQIRFFSGDAMGGKTKNLGKIVDSGDEVNLSINLTAPLTIGVYTSNWRMTDDTGAFFGDSFYVMINVVEGATSTAAVSSASPTPTMEPTPSETPE